MACAQMQGSQKVGRAVPSAPVKLTKTVQFESISESSRRAGDSTPYLKRLRQQAFDHCTKRREVAQGPERKRSNLNE